MSALSSLLVQDQIVSVSTIEEALQRQVIFGGQLDTNLLELRAVEEQLLVRYKAQVSNLAPALREEIDNVDFQAIRIVPREIAEAHGFVPLHLTEQRLRVAVCRSPAEIGLEQAASKLGFNLEPVMTSELRLRTALNRYYGVELPSRFSRLAGLLASGSVPAPAPREGRISFPSSVAPRSEPPRGVVDRGPPHRRGALAGERARPPVDDAAIQDQIAEMGLDPNLDLRDTFPGSIPASMLADYPSTPSILPLPAGLELIENATTREEVFDAALRVIGGMVEYSAVFVVKGRMAQGKAAWGNGTVGEELLKRPVLLEKPGALWTVSQSRAHYLGPLPPSRANDSLLEAIGRSRPATVLVVPVVIRNRTVVLIYADSGQRGAMGYELAALLPLASAMANTFERLILERKRGHLFSSAPPPPEEFSQQAPPDAMEQATTEGVIANPLKEVSSSFAQEASRVFAEQGHDGSVTLPSGEEFARDRESAIPHHLRSTPVPQYERTGKSTPEPAGLRSSDGVLILLTEVLGDPQQGAWPATVTERKVKSQDEGSATGESAAPAERPAQAVAPKARPTLMMGGAGREEAKPAKSTETTDGTDVVLVGEGAHKWESAPSASAGAGNGGVQGETVDEAPTTQAVTTGSEEDESGTIPRGLPDPGVLNDAVEPESIELMPGPEFLKGLESGDDSFRADLVVTPTPVGLVELEAVNEGQESESTPTPLEVALVGAADEPHRDAESPLPATAVEESRVGVPDEEASAVESSADERDDTQPGDEPGVTEVPSIIVEEGAPIEATVEVDDDFEVTVGEPVRDSALPDSASMAGNTVIRRTEQRPRERTSSLPTVIVDMGNDVEELVDRALEGGAGGEEAALELLQSGEVGLPSLLHRFPGEVVLDWEKLSLPVPEPSKHGPLLALLQRFGDRAIPYVLPKLNSADRSKRYYAVLLLGKLDTDDALEALGLRLLDYDAAIADLAAFFINKHVPTRSLRPSVGRAIRSALTDQRASETIVHRAIEAAGVVRDELSVPGLIDLLKSSKGGKRQATLHSLRVITGQDFGNSARRWSSWWSKSSKKSRLEWLIEALDHRQARVRARALTELQHLVPDDFGFQPEGPRRSREVARQRYLRWFEEVGRQQFTARN